MKILSLSTVYPNPTEPGLGLFVRSRLQRVAGGAQVKVVVPVPLLDYSNPARKLFCAQMLPFPRSDGAVEVFHPRWPYPPGGTPVNIVCLTLRLLPLFHRIRLSFRFDLIDAHFGYPEGVAAAILAAVFRVPFIITLRGSERMFAASHSRRLAMCFAFRRASHLIAVSEDLGVFAVEQGAPPDRVTVIPNGVETAVFFPRDRGRIRTRQGLTVGRKLILSAGELIEAKGHHHVIQSLRPLLERGWDVELWIVGSAARGGRSFESKLRQMVVDLGLQDRVRFLGQVDRNGMAELLSAADLFCLASFTEGWPNVVHEALACGSPVIATRVGGVPAMIPSIRYGLLVPPQVPDALLGALTCALETVWDRTAISEWGRSRSWDDVAREVIAVFEATSVEFARSRGRKRMGISPYPQEESKNVRH